MPLICPAELANLRLIDFLVVSSIVVSQLYALPPWGGLFANYNPVVSIVK